MHRGVYYSKEQAEVYSRSGGALLHWNTCWYIAVCTPARNRLRFTPFWWCITALKHMLMHRGVYSSREQAEVYSRSGGASLHWNTCWYIAVCTPARSRLRFTHVLTAHYCIETHADTSRCVLQQGAGRGLPTFWWRITALKHMLIHRGVYSSKEQAEVYPRSGGALLHWNTCWYIAVCTPARSRLRFTHVLVAHYCIETHADTSRCVLQQGAGWGLLTFWWRITALKHMLMHRGVYSSKEQAEVYSRSDGALLHWNTCWCIAVCIPARSRQRFTHVLVVHYWI